MVGAMLRAFELCPLQVGISDVPPTQWLGVASPAVGARRGDRCRGGSSCPDARLVCQGAVLALPHNLGGRSGGTSIGLIYMTNMCACLG